MEHDTIDNAETNLEEKIRTTSVTHESKKPSRSLGWRAWLQVLGSFGLNANTWGLLGSFGVYQTYYALELLQDSSDSAISWIGSVQGFFMFAVSFLIGPIFDAGYLHPLLWTGTLLSLLGFFMTSLCTQYWQIFLAQGVAMGIGFGCLYLPAPALVSMHFERHQALAMGLSSSGSGIGKFPDIQNTMKSPSLIPKAGAVIFPLVFNHLEPSIGFAWATRVLAFMLLGLSIIPLLVMEYPKDQEADGSTASPRLTISQYLERLVDKSAIRDRPFMLMIGGLTTTMMGLYIILYYINLYAIQRTSAPSSLSSQILTILNGASALGRILPSALADYTGPTHVLLATALIGGAMTFCLLAVSTSAGIVTWSVLFGIVAGAFMGLPAAGVVSVSNSKEKIGARLGMTLGSVGCGVLIAEPIAGAILGSSDGGWLGLLAWSGSLMFLGWLLVTGARIAKVGRGIRVKV